MTSRRSFLQGMGVAAASLPGTLSGEATKSPLAEFGYRDVDLAPGLAQAQFERTQAVLLSLNEDSLLKPWRLRAGLPAPGPDLGGWYDEVPLHKTDSGGHGFAPAHSFGQWISALARGYAVNRDSGTQSRLNQLLTLYEAAISGKFYANFRFPAYNYDKMVIGLIDAHQFGEIRQAYRLLELTTNAAEPHLPPRALDRDEPQRRWRESIGENTAPDYTWDESYTLPENLYLAWERGAGERYKTLAGRFLLDKTYFDPLAEGNNVLANHHAYSFCNALSSAMQAYLATGSSKHLRAASNAFQMINAGQSFATGGWGPNESFVAEGSDGLYKSLSETHRGFETPCGSYAHFKLTRYLLRVTRDGQFGDSMERVLYNTVLGAKHLEPDGSAFYYSDYHGPAQKTYFPDKWPCCSGTLPQVAADYRILCYFHDPDGLWVNLYLPSSVHYTTPSGAQATLSQKGSYPLDGKISFLLRTSRPSKFWLRFRIPTWAAGSETTLQVNGKRASVATSKGFAKLHRTWKDGDRVDLSLAMPRRLEAINGQHLDVAALLQGPLVLLAETENSRVATRAQLLAAEQVAGEPVWRAKSSLGELQLRPFFALGDDKYTTYLDVA